MYFFNLKSSIFILYFIIIIFPVPSNAKQKSFSADSKSPFYTDTIYFNDANLQEELIKYLGIRYKRGGTTLQGFDCSGFARLIYKDYFGVDLPHNASSQYPLSMLTSVSQNNLKTGDLIFFASTQKKKRINHVGIYLNDGKFIHAALKKGIIISDMNDTHWRKRLVSAKRLSSSSFMGSAVQNDMPDTTIHRDSAHDININVAAGKSSLVNLYATIDDEYESPEYIEYNYARSIINNKWNFHLIPFQARVSELSEGHDYTFKNIEFYMQGLKISNDIRPFVWLSITPAFTFFKYDKNIFFNPTRSFELDVAFGSLKNDGWTLNTALQYATLNAPPGDIADDNNKLTFFNMSLTYCKRLTDRMQLSLMGQTLKRSMIEISDDIQISRKYDQRFYFMLNLFY